MKDRSALATLGIVVFGVLARVVFIDADPPRWHGLGFIADEGWWAHNARNKALFGSFVMTEPRDEFNQGLVVSPFFTLCAWGSFAALGPSLASLRYVSAIASGIAAFALASICRRHLGGRAGPVAATLYLFAPFAWAFGRIGLVEETMSACLAVAMALFMGAGPIAWIGAGLAHAAGFATKSYAMFLGPALIASEILAPSARRWRKLACYGVGVGAGLAVWGIAIYLPYRDEYREINLKLSQDNLPRGLAAGIRNAALITFENPGPRTQMAAWLRYAPVPAVLLALALAAVCLRGIRALRGDKILAMALPLLAVYVVLLAPMQYKPDRRYHVLLVPEVLLACWAVSRLSQTTPTGPIATRALAATPLAALVATVLIAVAGVGRNVAAVLVAGLTLAIAISLGIGLPRLWPKLVVAARYPIAGSMAVFALVAGFEACHMSFTLRDEGTALAGLVKDDLVVGGVADTLLIGSHARTFNSMRKGTSGRFNGDLLSRAPIGYIMTWTQPERPEPVTDLTMVGHLEKLRETPILPDGPGRFRATVTLWRLDRDVAR